MEEPRIPSQPSTITKAGVTTLIATTITTLNNLRGNPDKDRLGGYVAIIERKTGKTVMHAKVGSIPQVSDPDYGTKENKYRTLAMKKAHQLYVAARAHGHVSGWQSRDEDKDQFGGAIIGEEYIIAFSGLTEHGDEIVSLILACAYDSTDAYQISLISQNPFWLAMHAWWQGGCEVGD